MSEKTTYASIWATLSQVDVTLPIVTGKPY